MIQALLWLALIPFFDWKLTVIFYDAAYSSGLVQGSLCPRDVEPMADLGQFLLLSLQARGWVQLAHVPGHSGNAGNHAADRLAACGAKGIEILPREGFVVHEGIDDSIFLGGVPVADGARGSSSAGPVRTRHGGHDSASSSLDLGFVEENELNLQEIVGRPLVLLSYLFIWMSTQHISWSCFMRAKGRLKPGKAVRC